MAKADFDDIYIAPDPRPYYRTLDEFDYQIPAHSGTVFGQLARAMADHGPAHIVDLCCSYGVNATTLNHDVAFSEVVEHYLDRSLDDLSGEELLEAGRRWFGQRRCADPLRICGLDSSEPAIDYATGVGLLDRGFAEDLESDDPSEDLSKELGRCDLVTVSGGIGYITEQTVGRVLERANTPRLAALCLRWVDFTPIAEVGAEYGLVTERLDEATFPQRQFTDGEEQRHVESTLSGRGIDPTGREDRGYHHTDLYVMRPPEEAEAKPLEDVLHPVGAVGEGGRPAVEAAADVTLIATPMASSETAAGE